MCCGQAARRIANGSWSMVIVHHLLERCVRWKTWHSIPESMSNPASAALLALDRMLILGMRIDSVRINMIAKEN
jgi:hypothetical protein